MFEEGVAVIEAKADLEREKGAEAKLLENHTRNLEQQLAKRRKALATAAGTVATAQQQLDTARTVYQKALDERERLRLEEKSSQLSSPPSTQGL